MGSALFSVLGGDPALADSAEAAELLQVTRGADQHDLRKLPGADILKPCRLFSGAAAGQITGFRFSLS